MMKGDFFMRIIQLPHRTADYLCPFNGLADLYEWKMGERIPEQLLFYARSGFCDVRKLIDSGIPVIIFGLDMFHLGYHEKFYHKIHIPGHVVLMVGYDDDVIYIHDNSMPEVQRISLEDLENAWGSQYLNISRKNAYFGIEFKDVPLESREILRTAYRDMANQFLNPATGFIGSRGLHKLISELPKWGGSFDRTELDEIFRFFLMVTGSVLPKLPKELDESDLSGLDNPHRGTRDRFADALLENCSQFGNECWITAAKHFSDSGKLIEKISKGFTRNILDQSYPDPAKFIPLFKDLLETEEKAFCSFYGKVDLTTEGIDDSVKISPYSKEYGLFV